jgi:hypothetical protein
MSELDELRELYELRAQQQPGAPEPKGPQLDQPGAPEPKGPQLDQIDAVSQGALQGLSMGFADELLAGGVTGYEHLRSIFTGDEARDFKENLNSVRSYRDAAIEQHPNTTMAADIAGSLAGGGGAYRALGKYAPKALLGNLAAGGVEGGINAVGRADDGDDMVGNLMFDIPLGVATGGLGYAVPEGIARAFRQRGYRPNSIRNRQADELGYEMSPAQMYDDESLHQIEAAMRSDPGYAQAFREMDAKNQKTATRIMTKAMGKESDTLFETDMGEISRNITKKFKDAEANGDFIDMDAQWLDDIDDIEAAYKKIPGKPDKSMKVIDDLRKLSDDVYITPREYQSNYSAMGKDLDKAAKAGDGNLVKVYADVRRALDAAADRAAPGLSSDFNEARQLYKAKKIIQKPGVMHERGTVSPTSLANKLRSDAKGYLEGGNTSDLYNLARVARAKGSRAGDSGTATRSMGPLESITMGPIKESIASTYLAGKFGTSMFGPRTGVGATSGMPISAAAQAILEEQSRKEELKGLLSQER